MLKALGKIISNKITSLWLLLTFIILSSAFSYNKKAKLEIKNIVDNFTDQIFYLTYRYKGHTDIYIHGVNSKEIELFNYKVDNLPLEIRAIPSSNQLLLSGGIRGRSVFNLLDAQFNLIPLIENNKLNLDPHDIQFLNNGNIITFEQVYDTIPANEELGNGVDPTVLNHFNILEINVNNNEVVNKWSSQNYFSVHEAGSHVSLKTKVIDYCHFNSLHYNETDNSLITSSRSLNEITKIKWPEGDIIWRLGGKCNEFKFINDSIGFNGQHQATLLNDTLMLFDNGAFHKNNKSSVVIYKLNESKKELELIDRFYGNDLNFTKRRGGVKKLENGNLLVTWGQNQNPEYQVSELDNKGRTLQTLKYNNPGNYRVNKGAWRPELLKIECSEKANDKYKISLENLSEHDLTVKYICIGTDTLKNEISSLEAKESKVAEFQLEKKVETNRNCSIEYYKESDFFVIQEFSLNN